MAWIKRNLFFVLGSIVALGLMVVGIVYLLAQIGQESQVADDIGKQYAELTRLTQLNPHPGDGKIDNIKLTKEQQAELHAYILKTRPFFQRITPIPDFTSNKIDKVEFAAEMRNTVSQLQHSASSQSVLLPPDYYFTFEAQKKIMNFDPASLDSLATHLGEIKALCGIFFDAKVNSIDSIRREVISVNDNNPPDYLPEKTVSTPLADITPYEVTFRCFSTELGQVLGNLASSPYGFVVKTINVESATSTEAPMAETGVLQGMGSPPPMSPPPGGGYPGPGGMREPYGSRGGRPMYPGAPPVAPVVAPPTRGPQEFLREKLFRVTLAIQVVKVRSTK